MSTISGPNPVIQPTRKKKKYAVRKVNDIQWKKVTKTKINTTSIKGNSDEYLNHYLRMNFPSFLK